MNIWDSVQRGLEKASQEAARIARAQKLRSTIDGLSRQANAQKDMLIVRTLDLFATGHLQDTELIPLCQELTDLQRQLEQAQNDLKALQTQTQATQTGLVNTPPPAQMGSTMPYFPPSSQFPPYAAGGEIAPTLYAPPPPDYQQSSERMTPPPPPGASPPTVSSMETQRMHSGAQFAPQGPVSPTPSGANPPTVSDLETLAMGGNPHPALPSIGEARQIERCPRCQRELIPGNVYCHNCGLFVQQDDSAHLPTMRGGTLEAIYPAGQPTVYADRGAAEAPASLAYEKTVAAEPPSSPYEKTVVAESPDTDPPYPFNASPKSQEGGQ